MSMKIGSDFFTVWMNVYDCVFDMELFFYSLGYLKRMRRREKTRKKTKQHPRRRHPLRSRSTYPLRTIIFSIHIFHNLLNAFFLFIITFYRIVKLEVLSQNLIKRKRLFRNTTLTEYRENLLKWQTEQRVRRH